ncbi:hypothetical protein K469DRAFT_782537 [Zopfia rhizophila CBS 207.26]|uniref:Heterokaryon incompatibility domain-containing protein n=1 Tax=Zopfia rhizophila CBS 207.26 TaxID=1314779 RepID=A0A6A6ESM4_9PEZI|nr:hypothetical protein K469DRAFT_782537 [Zopfia rhizophila CBS 207.26]
MYQWYKNSRICYTYLANFQALSELVSDNYKGFTGSQWWSRGWTLQELIAHPVVEFYNADWVEVGTKLSLKRRITGIMGIGEGIIRGADLRNRNNARGMAWAPIGRLVELKIEPIALWAYLE